MAAMGPFSRLKAGLNGANAATLIRVKPQGQRRQRRQYAYDQASWKPARW
jgi:hypothetical protein